VRVVYHAERPQVKTMTDGSLGAILKFVLYSSMRGRVYA